MEGQVSNRDFFFKLLDSFAGEIEFSLPRNAGLSQLKTKLEKLKIKAHGKNSLTSNWHKVYQSYLDLNREKAALLNDNSQVSRDYPDMETFWHDAEQQAKGLSQFTYWDTYEHGRRRQLEKLLAKSYGCTEVVLVNSGMGAVCSVLESLNLKVNDTLLTTSKNYFETYDYLEQYLKKKGINVIRVDTKDLASSIEKTSPQAILIETVGNHPDVPVFEQWQEVIQQFKTPVFVIDNSVQSHLTPWFKPGYAAPDNVIIVESATKYITEECVAGAIYGNGPLIENVRHYARTIGINLQEKCFNYLSEGLIQNVLLKLNLHSRNTQLFMQILADKAPGKLKFLRSLNHHAPDSAIFSQGQGCLIYLKYNSGAADIHRKILTQWKHTCGKLNLPIRAGFGWSNTTARSYDSANLNQFDAPNYLRISVGIEPQEIITKYANLLAKTINSV